MNASDFQSLMPLIVLTGGTLIVMLLVAIKRHHLITFVGTVVTLVVSFISLLSANAIGDHFIEPLFSLDSFGYFYMGLVFLASIVIAFLSYGYFEQHEENKEEFYLLLLLATLGAGALVVSSHFISLFMSLETLSVSLYAMIAYLRAREKSLEAGIKYLIMAAFASAFLLFGMALIYAESGSMHFAGIAQHLQSVGAFSTLMLTGLGLMIVGVGFKLGVVPFHLWTPDVYEGAPSPVTAFIATVSKGGMFAVLARFFFEIDGFRHELVVTVFMIITIASMFAGNLLALQQKNVKRILAYSSISHLGYLLVAFLAGAGMGTEAITFYFVAYFITTLGGFGVVAYLSTKERDAEELGDYQGLFWRRPLLACVFTAMLLSLAGIPLTAGFIGKYYIVAAGVDSGLWTLLIILVINSVIGLFYYLRIITTMFESSETTEPRSGTVLPIFGSAALAAMLLLVIWFGVFPGYTMEVIRALMMM
jgi:NADH-quinone oxidoreductase subunit N